MVGEVEAVLSEVFTRMEEETRRTRESPALKLDWKALEARKQGGREGSLDGGGTGKEAKSTDVSDGQKALGIVGWGFTETTLEEVFLKLAMLSHYESSLAEDAGGKRPRLERTLSDMARNGWVVDGETVGQA